MITNETDTYPSSKRFGHTITMVKKSKKSTQEAEHVIVLFGGAVGDNQYRITNDILFFETNSKRWKPMSVKQSDQKPSPRAAHAATAVENSQLVIFGGAHSHGQLVDNELYLLKVNDYTCKFIKVPIESGKPPSRYGHSMVFTRPFILIIGGNMQNEPTDEVWSLSIDTSPFHWSKIKFDKGGPCPRVYHSTALWQSSNKGDMVLLFGGRTQQNQALNDLWGLRKHNDGSWDWNLAPNKVFSGHNYPTERYQHTMVCIKNMMVVVGGRNNDQNVDIPMDVYNLSACEWMQFPSVSRFRHASYLINHYLNIHAGFEPKKPSVPTNVTTQINLADMFYDFKMLLANLESEDEPGIYSGMKMKKKKNGNIFASADYVLNPNIMVVHTINQQTNPDMVKLVHIDDLSTESQRLDPRYYKLTEKKNSYVETLYSTFLLYFLKPKEWQTVTDSMVFPVKSEIILSLCDEVIKILKNSPTLIYLRPGVKIFGSIHGQYGELLRFFDKFGVPDNDPSHRKTDIEALDFLFLGNYVDRGKHSLEVILLLLALKLKFPAQIHLLRGSHEDKEINLKDGLAFECESRLSEDHTKPNSVYNKLNEVFEHLPLAAVLGNKILCVHSGIGVNVQTLDQIAKIKRPFKLNHNDQSALDQKIVFDLLWSDPVLELSEKENKSNEIREYIAKGQIVRFGTDRIKNFMKKNNIEIIIRSHECVMDGCEKFGNTNLYTVFSHTGYGGAYQNSAAILHYKKNNNLLNTLCLPFLPNFSKWYNLTVLRSKWIPKSKTPKENMYFNPKDRPVTPPRHYIQHKKNN